MKTNGYTRPGPFLLMGIGFLVAGFFPVIAQAQPGSGPAGGWGAGSAYNRQYNPATVVTLSGTVTTVDRFAASRNGTSGIHVVLKTGDETVPVHLGPAWFVENQDAQLQVGDEIEVTGSRITFDGRPAILAAEVKRGGDVLRLRERDGFPAWHGWRRAR